MNIFSVPLTSKDATHKGAGILFRAKDGSVLFLKRGPGGDYPGFWCLPGGHAEDGEDAEATARREAAEEVGSVPKGSLSLLARSVSVQELAAPAATAAGAAEAVALPVDVAPNAPLPPAPKVVDFATFLMEVDAQFPVERDDEHVGFAWAPASSPPEPLLPGCRAALDRLAADELGVARMIAEGRLTSPQRYRNVTLWAMRITGTGVAYRRPVLDEKTGKVLREEEFPWRDPSLYLNDEFLARCNGLPVIWGHPKGSTLDSKEFARRQVGTIFLPYVRGDEVWGIAKVYDDDANDEMSTNEMSTSPSVVLSDPANPSWKFRLEDGSLLLVEGKPSLLDHLAICERGVWDKGGEPSGVINDSDDAPGMDDVVRALSWLAYGTKTLEMRVDTMARRSRK